MDKDEKIKELEEKNAKLEEELQAIKEHLAKYRARESSNDVDIIKCPMCFECKQLKRNHFVCTDCFNRCYYVDESVEPVFPYSEIIQDEYFGDIENPKWETEYPLINVYNEEWDKWARDQDYSTM